MAPGANVPTKSGTGTVPKSKSRNTPIHYLSPVVRREMVAPTRRDIQMNMNSAESYDWRPESENGGNVPINSSNYSSLLDFYSDLDSTVSHDNNRFVPVRPQPRSLGLSQQEDENLHSNGFHSNSPSNMSAANTAIVMPTTPGTSRTRETTPSYRRADRACVVLNPVSQNNPQNDSVNVSSQTIQSVSGAADGSSGNNVKTSNVPTQMPDRQVLEQKLQQIREYLKITTSMIQSVGDENQVVTDEDVDMLRLINELKDSEAKLVKQLSEYDKIDESHVENINKNEAADVERASSSLSQTSQSSYNTLSTKLQPQQTINQVGPNDAERTKVDCKNKQIHNSNNIVTSSNRSSQDSGTTLNPINNDEQRNVASNSGGSNEGVAMDGDAKRFDLTGRKLQQDLKVLLENLKGGHSVNNENNIDLSNQDLTPDENAKVRRLEATVSQLQERLHRLRTVSEEQNANDVYLQLENIKNLNERIAKLRQRTEEREEINRILGERDEQLSAEHRALQDKLRDLHHKKEQVEKLVNDLQNLARAPPIQDQSLASMRSQLASFQAMLDSVTRTETELNHNPSVQQPDSQSVASANCLINKYENINGDRTKNRNVYHPIDFPIENRDSLDEEEDVARGGGRFDKKVNKNTAIVGSFERQQMILTAELQAKKRELEELMRKDQGCSSSVNQDTCNTSTIDKSEIPRFPQEENFLSGGRSSLDNHSDNDYTSDDDEVGENNASLRYSSSVNVSNNQLNNHIVPPSNNSNVSNHLLNVNKTRSKVRASPNLSNREITTDMSACSTPEPLPNTVWRKTSQTSHHSQPHLNNTKKSQEQSSITNHDAASMSICSGMESMPPPMTPLWRKTSQGSMWNASPWYFGNTGTQRAEVGNVANLDTVGNNTSSSGRQQPTQGTKEWWQKKALQLQQQLELTSNLCQSILVDQQVASSQSPSSSINNEPAYLSYPPVPFNASQFMPVRTSGTGQPINSADLQCQNLVAASQFHFQSMLMTSLNHCYQLIWMQQKELSLLRNMVTTLQESILGNGERLIANSCSNLSNSQSQNMSNLRSNLQNQKPCVQNPPNPSQNNENLTNHQNFPQNVNSINNFSNLQTSNSLNAQNCFQNGQQFQNNTNLQQQNIPNPNLNFNTQNFQNNIVPVQNVPCISPNFNNQSIANNLMPLQFQSDTAQRPQCVQNIQAAPTSQNISWNGVQALNNQVPPGNRANNYWDNFRSYSRQNLLSTTSTKSNEGSSHSPSPLIDRAHNNMFRTNGFLGPVESFQLNHATLPKMNTNTVQDDAKVTRQKKSQIRQSSDVSINVNQNNETGQFHLNNQNLSADMSSEQTTAAAIHNHLLNIIQQNLNSESDGSVSNNTPSNLEQRSNGTDISNVRAVIDSAEPSFSNSESTKCLKQQSSQRNIYDPNEWRENAQNDSRNERPKTKLFDILRDNVYKEVASLISANENRPHFLIQLFRDLQLISSDGLRHRTLQSIQGVVTDSLANLPDNGQGASRQNVTASAKKENSQSSEISNDEIKSNYNTESANSTTTNQPDLSETAKLERDIHAVIYNLVPFFHVNADNICSDLMTETIRTLALQMIPTITFSDNPDKIKYYFSYCHSQLNSNLENALTKYHGCRLRDVTEDILSVITEVVINELSYVFGNETRDFNTEMSNESTEQSQSYEPSPESQASSDNHVEQECNSQVEERSVVIDCQPSLHNGDLAEADQSHENEEEGAVGGILNPDDGIALIKSEDVSSEDTGGNTEADSEWITFETGLDCIPSRLADGNTNTENTNTSDKPPGQPYD